MRFFSYIVKSLRAYRSGKLGDAALYELAAYRSPSAEVVGKLSGVANYYPTIDLEQLRNLPEGTLGREYARFMDRYGIQPFSFSDEVKREFANDPFTVRYIVTHDLHHLLTGFDTGLAGELGLFAVTYAQGIVSNRWVLRFAKLLTIILSPMQARRALHNLEVGLEIGRRATMILGERLEEQFERPLADVRAEFNIPDPTTVAIQPSRMSWFMQLVAPSLNPKLSPA